MKPLKKSVVKEILEAYSIRQGEFIAVEGAADLYKSHVLHSKYAYYISIINETDALTGEPTGRIFVNHSDSTGRRTFTDIWESDKEGRITWKYRNPADMPPTDAEIIRDLQEELEKVKAAGREIEKELLKYQKLTPIIETDLTTLKQEEGKTPFSEMEQGGEYQKSDPIIDTKRKAGRPSETEKQAKAAREIKMLLEQGLSDKEIMEKLNIKRATYYRRKKTIISK